MFHRRAIGCAFLAILWGLTLDVWASPPPQQDELQAVLERAARYVSEYEEKQLGNLLAVEDYVQSVDLSRNGRFGLTREQRRTESDFLILLLGEKRVALRRVNTVDGKAVTDDLGSFADMSDSSPEGLRRQLAAVANESTKYNIGPVVRQINVPTFALAVARASEQRRFSFEQHGTRKIDGVQTWEVRFKEQRSPTLTHGMHGESLLSTGALWIEPETGRILRTEFSVENPFSDPKVKGKISVGYKQNQSLGMLVPTEMNESYESATALVYCSARYSDFRIFNVDVHSVIEKDVSK